MPSILFYTHTYTYDRSESYRIGQYFPFLERRGFRVYELDKRTSYLKVLKIASISDIVYIQRILLSPIKFWLLRKVSRRIVFDFDDAIMFGENQSSGTRMRRFERIVKGSDATFCGNRFLLSIARRFKSNDVYYVPTTVDPSSYPQKTYAERDEPFTIGWMGTASTLKYLSEVEDLIHHYSLDPGIRFLIVCDREPEIRTKNLYFLKWEKDKEKKQLLSFDLGIMPQRDDLWSKGKCGLKLIQYMASSLPSISHPYGVSNEIIENNVSGFLREKVEDWIEVIETLRKDRKLALKIGRNARKVVEEKYSILVWGEKVADILASLIL